MDLEMFSSFITYQYEPYVSMPGSHSVSYRESSEFTLKSKEGSSVYLIQLIQ